MLAALENALERNRISWSNVSAVVTIGGGASIPLITQRLSEHSQAPVVTTPQPALDAAVGAALFAAYGSEADAKTGVAPVLPVDVPDPVDAPGSATFRALAWSQDDDTADDVVPYTGDLYDTGGTAARPQVQYVPPTEPIEEPRTWHRLPQLVFGLAAVVAVVAVGGVAVALTSATDSTKATEPPSTATSAPGPTSAAPPPSSPPPVETVTVDQRAATAAAVAHTHDDGSTADDDIRHHDDAAYDHNHDNHNDDNHNDDDDHDHDDDDDHHNDADDNHHDHNDDATDDDDVHQSAVRAGADSDSGAADPAVSASAVPVPSASACCPERPLSSTFRGWWQAATCAEACSSKAGSSVVQISVAHGHRVWKLQPGGGSIGLGTSPCSTSRSRAALRFGSGMGTADSSAFVYG